MKRLQMTAGRKQWVPCNSRQQSVCTSNDSCFGDNDTLMLTADPGFGYVASHSDETSKEGNNEQSENKVDFMSSDFLWLRGNLSSESSSRLLGSFDI